MTITSRQHPPRPVGDARDLLTLGEKVRLLEGVGSWTTTPVARVGIPALFVTDGPHGVRRVRADSGAFGVSDNVPATAFPTAATVAASWDPANARLMGEAIGHEAHDLGVDVVLGPGVNITRSPLCGRTFEYYSEDPLVSGVFGSAFVQGVQSRGVGASVKHFAANSTEDFRFVGNSLVDERALREIYLRQFERVVREGRPWTVMNAYNRLNDVFCSDDRRLLTGILRDEWGFDGVVMTDWGATHDRVAALNAGCDLDMPGEVLHNRAEIVRAFGDGRVSAETLDTAVGRMLQLIDRCTTSARPAARRDPAAHAALARRIAADSAVLLANDGTLPLGDGEGRIAVIGDMFDRMRFQGAGSSLINPTDVTSPRAAFDRRGAEYVFARGYRSLDSERDPALEAEAVAAAAASRVVLFFGGLSDLDESEGFDRGSMALAPHQNALLDALLATGAPVVLVLFAGAPVELEGADRFAAVLDMALPGMQGGEAVADLLFGDVNPSGKLAQSWPATAADAGCAADWNTGPDARYYESIYVGYRFYDRAGTRLRYPFGHGLSYTAFGYDDLRVHSDGDRVSVTVRVTNTGARDGAEVVQLYVRNNAGAVFKADKELRAFAKVRLDAGAAADVDLSFPLGDLAYWDVADGGWRLENGDYEILVAASAADIRLSAPLVVTTGAVSRSPYPVAVDADYALPPRAVPASFPQLLGRAIASPEPAGRLTMETRLGDARRSLIGGILYRAVMGRMRKAHAEARALPDGHERDAAVKNTHFLVRMMPSNSLRSMVMSSSGAMPWTLAAGLADIAAGHPVRGIRRLFDRNDARTVAAADLIR